MKELIRFDEETQRDFLKEVSFLTLLCAIPNDKIHLLFLFWLFRLLNRKISQNFHSFNGDTCSRGNCIRREFPFTVGDFLNGTQIAKHNLVKLQSCSSLAPYPPAKSEISLPNPQTSHYLHTIAPSTFQSGRMSVDLCGHLDKLHSGYLSAGGDVSGLQTQVTFSSS